jgi:Zn-dependent M28 family amino/carboxypeptidase
MMTMSDQSYGRPLTEDGEALRGRLEKHVSTLAGEIGERNIWYYDGLVEAAGYIEHALLSAGYEVGRQEFNVQGFTVANLEVTLTGQSKADEIVVVGAHYDSVVGSPGANDNGTGVAALLEIARLLAGATLHRTVRFVAFVNEEPPFFQTGHMGSQRYAKRARERGDRIVAMLSLETIGYYSDEPGSQRYPFPMSFFYPKTANFIGFVGNLSSRRLVQRAARAFRGHSDFPAESAAAPGWLTGIGWSDHAAFWQEGYAAIMVTDTALFRYAHYHTLQDTPDKVDYGSLARVTKGLAHVVEDLAR